MSYYAKAWIIQRKKKYRKILDCITRKAFGSIIFTKLVKSWLLNFNKIKKAFRQAFCYRISLLKTLLARWVQAESEQFSNIPLRKNKRSVTIISSSSFSEKNDLEGLLSIPTEIKLYYLKKFMIDRIVKYMKKFKKFKINFDSIHRQNKKNRFQLNNNQLVEYPKPPRKVIIFDEFNIEKLKNIINFALKDKAQWRNILYGQAGKSGKQYKRRISLNMTESLDGLALGNS